MSRRRLLAALFALVLGSCRDQAPTALAPVPRPTTPDAPNLTPNVAPGALFAIAPRYPAPGDTVTFDGSYSQDGDGQVVQYRWNFGTASQQVTGAVARTVFRTAGTYPVSLTVLDDRGDSTTSTFALTVGTGGTPANAVSAALSTVAISAASTAAGTPVTATVTVRNAAGTALSGVTVAVSAPGRSISVSPATATTNGSGVATASVSSTVGQSSTVRAVADYTAITQTQALTITPSVVSATQSTIRLTQASLIGVSDTAIVEVTARDANGNVVPNATVALSASVTGLTLPGSGTTDANGRWTGVVRMVSLCNNTASTITATAGGTTLSSTVAITGTGVPAFGVCGASLWLDASDVSTQTLDGSNRVSQWRDKSGWSRHASNGTLASQPTSVAGGLNGQRIVRFTSASLLRSQNVLRGITNAAEIFLVAGAAAGQINETYIFGADSQFTLHPTVRFSSHLPWTDGNVLFDFGTCCGIPPRSEVNVASAGAAVPAAQWSMGSMPGSTPERHIRRNGSVLISGSTPGSRTFTDEALRIGYQWAGDLAEFIVFPRTLTTTERLAIENGLMAKWFLGTLAISAGNNQTAAAGNTLGTAPQVRVTNAAGSGVSGATITWTVTSGGGRVNGALSGTSTTDASGFATAPNWVMDVGSNSLSASYGSQSVVFTGTGTLPTGVTLRLDFSTTSTVFTGSGCTGAVSNNSPVGCATDQSGNSFHATQSTTGARPTYVSAGINGRGSLQFSQSSDIYLIVNAATIRSLRNSSRSIFAVGYATSTVNNTTNAGGAIVNWTGYNTGIRFDGNPVPTVVAADMWQDAVNGGSATFTASPLSSAGATTVVSHTVTVSGSTFFMNLWTNGANATVSTTASGTPTNAADMFVGIAAPGTSGYNWRLNGQLGEIIIYSRVVSTAERQQLERYLGWKWGVTVP